MNSILNGIKIELYILYLGSAVSETLFYITVGKISFLMNFTMHYCLLFPSGN